MCFRYLREYKVVIVGESGSGKSGLITAFFRNNPLTQHNPCLEAITWREVTVDGIECSINVLDTAGHKEHAALRRQYTRDGEAFIVAFDVTSRTSFEKIEWWYSEVSSVKNTQTEEGLQRATSNNDSSTRMGHPDAMPSHWFDSTEPVIMLVGCKADLATQREVSREEVAALARVLGCPYIETSSVTGENVDATMYGIVRLFRHQLRKGLSKGQIQAEKGKIKEGESEKVRERKESAPEFHFRTEPDSQLRRLLKGILGQWTQ